MESYINLDKNMIVNTTIGDVEVEWHDVRDVPFELYGLHEPKTAPMFRRVPHEIAMSASEKIDKISQESTGGRVRFSTDSPYIAIRAKFLAVGKTQHMPLISSAGFDLYIDGEFGSRYVKEFRMPYSIKDYYEQIIDLDGDLLRSYTINFPVRSVVESVEIGLKPGAVIESPKPYREIEPIIFYGSSIVHGTGTSHAGLAYPAIISRELNVDFRNMGFAGNARGEPQLAEWFATFPMSVFVFDYDHNAPTIEHLEKTHKAFYDRFREVQPDTPIIFATRPHSDALTGWLTSEEVETRYQIVKKTYDDAIAAGDKNVYFIDGSEYLKEYGWDECILDGIHPNDLGYFAMANNIQKYLEKIIAESGDFGKD